MRACRSPRSVAERRALECGGLPPLWGGRRVRFLRPPLPPHSGGKPPHSKASVACKEYETAQRVETPTLWPSLHEFFCKAAGSLPPRRSRVAVQADSACAPWATSQEAAPFRADLLPNHFTRAGPLTGTPIERIWLGGSIAGVVETARYVLMRAGPLADTIVECMRLDWSIPGNVVAYALAGPGALTRAAVKCTIRSRGPPESVRRRRCTAGLRPRSRSIGSLHTALCVAGERYSRHRATEVTWSRRR